MHFEGQHETRPSERNAVRSILQQTAKQTLRGLALAFGQIDLQRRANDHFGRQPKPPNSQNQQNLSEKRTSDVMF
eukprot:6482898-Amphidinium_carterae.1